MNILNNGRFGIGAATGAMMRKTLTACAEHASQRKQFGNPLSSYGLIQEKFATIASDTYANESLAYVDGEVFIGCLEALQVFRTRAWRTSTEP